VAALHVPLLYAQVCHSYRAPLSLALKRPAAQGAGAGRALSRLLRRLPAATRHQDCERVSQPDLGRRAGTGLRACVLRLFL